MSRFCGKRKRVGRTNASHICKLLVRHKRQCLCSCGINFIPTLRPKRTPLFVLKVYGLEEEDSEVKES